MSEESPDSKRAGMPGEIPGALFPKEQSTESVTEKQTFLAACQNKGETAG